MNLLELVNKKINAETLNGIGVELGVGAEGFEPPTLCL